MRSVDMAGRKKIEEIDKKRIVITRLKPDVYDGLVRFSKASKTSMGAVIAGIMEISMPVLIQMAVIAEKAEEIKKSPGGLIMNLGLIDINMAAGLANVNNAIAMLEAGVKGVGYE
jgi:hypothetical protein